MIECYNPKTGSTLPYPEDVAKKLHEKGVLVMLEKVKKPSGLKDKKTEDKD